jgi:hypothetical protein
MAGSLAHIIGPDGSFTPEMCENLGDCYEALAEFHQFVALVSRRWGGERIVRECMESLAYPVPEVMPKLDPTLHGAASKFRT